MADFEQAFDYVMGNEDPGLTGTVVNEPKGGIAKYGINSQAHPGVNVRGLTLEKAKVLYKTWYWFPTHLAMLTNQRMINKCFDTVIWEGCSLGGSLIQTALNKCGKAVPVDGHIGPITIQALNAVSETVFMVALKDVIVEHLKTRAAKDTRIAVMIHGLLLRGEKG